MAKEQRFFGRAAGFSRIPHDEACCAGRFGVLEFPAVGGNVVMSRPARAMISATAAPDEICALYPRIGPARQLPVLTSSPGRCAGAPAAVLSDVRHWPFSAFAAPQIMSEIDG
jgi:hypothetical protein